VCNAFIKDLEEKAVIQADWNDLPKIMGSGRSWVEDLLRPESAYGELFFLLQMQDM
jgi:hypothetical protein